MRCGSPVPPLLAETVAVLAGGLGVSWSRMILGSVAGMLPTTVAYATAGAMGARAGFVWVTAAVIALGGLAWVVDRRLAGRGAAVGRGAKGRDRGAASTG